MSLWRRFLRAIKIKRQTHHDLLAVTEAYCFYCEEINMVTTEISLYLQDVVIRCDYCSRMFLVDIEIEFIATSRSPHELRLVEHDKP